MNIPVGQEEPPNNRTPVRENRLSEGRGKRKVQNKK